MKVLMVHPSLEIVGGLPAYVTGLVDFLQGQPEIELQQLDETAAKGHATILNAQPVHRLLRGSVRLRREFVRRLDTFRPGVVHLHPAHGKSLFEKTVLAWIAVRRGARVILHLHGPDLSAEMTGRRRMLAALYRLIWSRPEVTVVVLSRQTRNFLQHEMPSVRIVLLPNGVQIPPTPGELRCSPVRIGFLGVMNGFKGEKDFVEAVGRISSGAFEAWMAGDGPGREALRNRIEELGLGDRVKLLGTVRGTAKEDFFNQTDLLCLPSRTDNLPLAILEAMARARPVVASRVGGIPELVEDGVTGWLVDAGDVAGLATTLQQAMVDTAELRRRGQQGWERVRMNHDQRVHGGRVLALYQGAH